MIKGFVKTDMLVFSQKKDLLQLQKPKMQRETKLKKKNPLPQQTHSYKDS